MAKKGLLEIIFKDNGFVFGRLKALNKNITLEPAEKVLLSKLFRGVNYKANEGEVRWRFAHRLFSQKIALFYYLLYHEAFEKGLFVQEPSALHRHYRKWGLIFFFGGLLGVFLSWLWQMPNLVILWFSVMLAGVLVIKLSPRINFLSRYGLEELKSWLAFRNFLTSKRLFKQQDSQILFDYLPFAVALSTSVLKPSVVVTKVAISALLTLIKSRIP